MADMDSDNESYASGDSDKELQLAFSQGLLKPGLNVQLDAPKDFINNVEGMKRVLAEMQKDLPWIERMDLVTDPAPAPQAVKDLEDLNNDGDSVHDDFKREMLFYRQAQAAVLEGLPRLQSLGLKTRRPDDYMAEMAKTDEHMKKVREKLLSKQMAMERSEKAKKMRELRKYGKKVQTEVLQKRQKEKREMMEKVKKVRKGKLANLDFLDDDGGPKEKDKSGGRPQTGKQSGQLFQPNKKRQAKNARFGFGGQKKRSKYNTKESAGNMSEYSVSKHGSRPGKKGSAKGGKKQQRPGKKRRNIAKNKKR